MPLTEEQKTNLKVFEICGVEYVYRNKQCKATCPLCDKRNHFYIDPETTKWDCKSCGERGNNYSFLTDYVNRSSAGCSQRELRTLRRLRNNFVPSATLKRHGLFQNHNGEWCLPIRNRKGTVTNLKRWNPRENTFFGLPGMGVGLFNIHNLKKKGPIFVCEGEWDAIALDWLLRACKIKDFTVVGLPGAAAFKESWGIFFGGREVYLCFDNDKPGQDGLDRTAQILSARKRPPSKMYRLVWPDGLKVGYDVRDFVTEGRKRPNDSLKEFQGRFIEVELENASEPAREPLERNTFEEVLADFKQVYHVTQDMEDCILFCLAIIATTPIRRDPVWGMLVGPPGSGKTCLIDAFQWCTHVADHHSTLTATTMVSGYKVPNGDGTYKDMSLIHSIDGKTLFIKDLTAILSKPATVQDEFFGLIRDIYDGHYKHQFGNGKVIDVHDVNFSIVAGVTPEIHKTNRTALGERFIKMNITGPDFDPEDNIRAALKNVSIAKETTELVCASVLGFVNTFDMDPTNPPHCPEWFEENLIALTQVVAFLRAKVHKGDDILYRQEPEVAARIGKQLKKLAQGVAYVLKKDAVDTECYRLIKKAALDSCMGIPLEIMGMLMKKENRYGVKASYVADRLQLSETQVKNVLRAFQELGATTYTKSSNNSGRRGRDAYLWKPSLQFRELWKRSGLRTVKPGRTPSSRTKRSRTE